MKNNKLKELLIAVGIFIIVVTGYNKEYKYNPNYEIIEEEDEKAFARYSRGKVYIGTKKEILSFFDEIKEDDIIVLDQRNNIIDPNMKIISSYKIHDKEIRNEILEIICKYEEKHPSNWDRTIEAMRLEWFMHNVSYYLNHQTNRTGDVDLNNNDEKYYKNKIIGKILKI